MQRITISLPEDLHDRLTELAGESGPYDSKSEAVRGLIHDLENEIQEYESKLRDAHDQLQQYDEQLQDYEEKLTSVREEYEREIEDLQRENERLQRQLAATNRRVDEHQELIEYVEEQREIERYRGRREQMLDQAGMLTRWKWKFTGVPVDEPKSEIGNGGHD